MDIWDAVQLLYSPLITHHHHFCVWICGNVNVRDPHQSARRRQADEWPVGFANNNGWNVFCFSFLHSNTKLIVFTKKSIFYCVREFFGRERVYIRLVWSIWIDAFLVTSDYLPVLAGENWTEHTHNIGWLALNARWYLVVFESDGSLLLSEIGKGWALYELNLRWWPAYRSMEYILLFVVMVAQRGNVVDI